MQSKLVKSRIDTRRREKKAQTELVVKASKVEETSYLELEEDLLSDGDRRRKLAAALVMIGSIMGILSGTLILQGNPASLLDLDIFNDTNKEDLHGLVLDQSGDALENVTIELIDIESGSAIDEALSDENGRYVIDDVLVRNYELHVSKAGYGKVILTFKPEPIGISPITLIEGGEDRTENELSETEGWSLEAAVALATVEGIFTISCALVGVHASFEIRRKKNYRRTQFFCWIGLFSRGLIIFGPALILLGMILIMLNKEDFENESIAEAT